MKLLAIACVLAVSMACAQVPLRTGPVTMARPVRVLIDPELPACEIDATLQAVGFWRRRGAAIDIDVWPQVGRLGDVAVIDAETGEPNVLGLTIALESTVMPGRSEVVAAVVVLDSCLPRVATHELGHAMGLPHREHRGALMYPTESGGGWDVSPVELSWLGIPGAAGRRQR